MKNGAARWHSLADRVAMAARCAQSQLSTDGPQKEAGPSNQLREWFSHDPENGKSFKQIFAELDTRPESWELIMKAAKTRYRKHCSAVLAI